MQIFKLSSQTLILVWIKPDGSLLPLFLLSFNLCSPATIEFACTVKIVGHQ